MEWISVDDRLPEDGDYSVFAAFVNGSVEPIHSSHVKIHMDMVHVQDWVRDNYIVGVTHWMPLPQPPEDD